VGFCGVEVLLRTVGRLSGVEAVGRHASSGAGCLDRPEVLRSVVVSAVLLVEGCSCLVLATTLDVGRACEPVAEPIEKAHRPGAYAIIPSVIVSLHVATGAAVGALVGSRPLALLLGPALHVAGDRVPHEDIPDRSFEIGSGLVALGLLAARRGPFDPAVLGGAAAAMPDLEHIVPRMRLRGEKLFHRGGGRHGAGIAAETQLVLAGATLGWLLARRL
jgi:hypothetical protein